MTSYDPTVRAATQMRKNRQHLAKDDAWIRAFLNQAQYCTVATSWDDLPFCNATLFWYDEAQHRIIFHSNVTGRVRANIEHNPRVCLSTQEMGKLLPSNAAIELGVQYRGAVVFGEACVIEDLEAARTALYGLIQKYFPKMQPGVEFRPITDDELRHTSIFEIRITEWSGKENWVDMTDQIDDWTPLPDNILAGDFR